MTSRAATQTPTEPLVARTVRVDRALAGRLLEHLPDERPVTGLRNGDGLVGWGVAAEIRTSGATRFSDADKWWSETTARAQVLDEVGEPGTGLVSFGSFAFADEPGDSVLVVPSVVLGRRGDTAWLTTVTCNGSAPTLDQAPRPDGHGLSAGEGVARQLLCGRAIPLTCGVLSGRAGR